MVLSLDPSRDSLILEFARELDSSFGLPCGPAGSRLVFCSIGGPCMLPFSLAASCVTLISIRQNFETLHKWFSKEPVDTARTIDERCCIGSKINN